jgi:alpha-L-rhamnosidase
MNVTNLCCEYRSNPLGIDVLAPRLSWVLASNRRGARQTAYQIPCPFLRQEFALDQPRGFQDPGMNSLNYYAYGSIGEWLYAAVAGIDADPERPGFKHILLRPHPGGRLTYVKAAYDSMYGRIVSHWRTEDDRFAWQVTIPPNTTATVYVPASEDAQITEGETAAEEAEGVTFLRREAEAAVYEVTAGDYDFSVR